MDPFPQLTALRQWFNRAITFLAAAIPVAMVVLGVAGGQTFETIFYMTIFGLIISMMLISSFRPKRTWLSEVLTDYLSATVRRSKGAASSSPRTSPVEPPDVDVPPAHI